MSYHITNTRQQLGYALESPHPIVVPTKIATRGAVVKRTTTPVVASTPPVVTPEDTAADPMTTQAGCQTVGWSWDATAGTCSPPTVAQDPAACAAQGGTYDATSGLCIPGMPTTGLQATQCFNNGGSWDSVNNVCMMPAPVQQPPVQSWLDSLGTTVKYIVIGGAVVLTVAIGAGVYVLTRKPKAKANRRRHRRNGEDSRKGHVPEWVLGWTDDRNSAEEMERRADEVIKEGEEEDRHGFYQQGQRARECGAEMKREAEAMWKRLAHKSRAKANRRRTAKRNCDLRTAIPNRRRRRSR